MIRKTFLTAAFSLGVALSITAPAHASWWGGGCKFKCGGSSTSGGTTTGGTSGGTKVPEPGMLGLMGAGLVGLAIARKKARKG
ncbi:PEP-CTERM sorting domain-containing protein [uncultured Novosphingobium sp.]|uniref:PEP-CTERM sorting domain-containing protein n=1 Tax=uncultured Novosphingobium sp. TaxID=292277 RepID=UPI000737AC68|nr:PEP-CTERM sorting domain-containing protein [uncultured Novosphingobium sp.]KTR82405.1 hypothetical protein NS277_14050 [Novosphingobium barchaimii]